MAELKGYEHGWHYSQGNDYLVNWPAGREVGDLVVVAIHSTGKTIYPPNFNQLYRDGTSVVNKYVGWKVVTASDLTSETYRYKADSPPLEISPGVLRPIQEILVGPAVWSAWVFRKGTFNPDSAINQFTYDIGSYGSGGPVHFINGMTGNIVTEPFKDVYHWNGAFWIIGLPDSPSVDVSLTGRPDMAQLWRQYGSQLTSGSAESFNSGAITRCVDEVLNNHVISWSSLGFSSAALKIAFEVADPPGAVTMTPLSATPAYVMSATFQALPVSPANSEATITVSPTMVVLVDGDPQPFQVQIQVADSADFSFVVWETTQTGQVPGQVSVQVGVGLMDKTTYYWRARAGDGTSWGSWSLAWTFTVDLETTVGRAYVYSNIGIERVLEPNAHEYLLEDIGIERALDPAAHQYLTANIGFLREPKPEANEYLYLGEVNTDTPTPHVWFLYKRTGFAADHVFVYGQGLGTLQSDFNADVWMDYGPNHDLVDIIAPVEDWSVLPSTSDAFGPDRRIYIGTDEAPPFTNVETDVVEIIIPVEAAPPPDAGAQTDPVYVKHDGGESNRVPFLIYPRIPLPMSTSSYTLRTGTAIRLKASMPNESLIEQRRARLSSLPYMVVGGRAEMLPEYGAIATTSASIVGTPGLFAGLEDPFDKILFGVGARWEPADSALVPRPELGTGITHWDNTVDATPAWQFHVDSAPYVDPALVVGSRDGAIVRKAMVFPGDAWAEMTEAVTNGPIFSMVMVVRLHAVEAIRGVILSSFNETPDPDSYPLELSYSGDKVGLTIGSKVAELQIGRPIIDDRPVILAFTTSGSVGTFWMVHDKVDSRTVKHPRLPTSGMKLYLGRSNDAGDMLNARMDVLDLAYSASVLSKDIMWRIINQLDGAYGVSSP